MLSWRKAVGGLHTSAEIPSGRLRVDSRINVT